MSAHTGWLISVLIWLVFAIINFVSNRTGYREMAVFSLGGMLVSLGFILVFLGFTNGWW